MWRFELKEDGENAEEVCSSAVPNFNQKIVTDNPVRQLPLDLLKRRQREDTLRE